MKRTPGDAEGGTGEEGRASEIEQQAAEWVARIDLRGTPEEWVQWMAVPGGIVAWERETDVLKLNGERQLFFAPIASWFDHPHGLVVQQPGGRITLVVVRDPQEESGGFNPDEVMCE